MQYQCTRRGFTLIELLVVVLIIGILAAVAVPQYQKAVKKSRFSEWLVYVNSFYKGIDLWVLENGVPSENYVRFSGDGSFTDYMAETLDIDLVCDNKEKWCYTKLGRFHVACGAGSCWVDMGPGGKDFISSGIETSKYYDGSFGNQPVLTKVPTDSVDKKLVCEIWNSYYGKAQMTENVITACESVGIK